MLIAMMAVPLASFAEGSVITTTSVTLQGDENGTGCAIWLEPAEPMLLGILSSATGNERQLVSRQFSLRVVNGHDVLPSSCVVTVGGASFQSDDAKQLAIHKLKLSQSPDSDLSVYLVPQVNEMAAGEMQSILVKAPEANGCAMIVATLEFSALPLLPAGAIVLGTLTLTMSDTAP
ncbi:hypothetical protein BH09CHL1_BH09CHL1_01140 [soil metagenome]